MSTSFLIVMVHHDKGNSRNNRNDRLTCACRDSARTSSNNSHCESDCTKHRPANEPQEWDSDHRSTIDLSRAWTRSREMFKGGRKCTKQRREHETGATVMAPA